MESMSSNLEDYLEVIFSLESQHSEARAKDIADAMGVQRASVTSALQKLSSQGLINYEPYNAVTLTPEGFHVATSVVHRHKVLCDFLQTVLGIRWELADATACKLEHDVDDESLDALIRFVHFIRMCPRTGLDWMEAFKKNSCGKKVGTCEECIHACLERQKETSKK